MSNKTHASAFKEKLTNLLSQLDMSNDVGFTNTSNATITFGDLSTVTLTAKECRLVFQSVEVAEMLLNAIPVMHETSIELQDLTLPDDVTLLLEESLASLDEV